MPQFLEAGTQRLAAAQLGRLRYNSPWTQVVLVGFVCFCSVGTFSALGGLGAGGLTNVQLADKASGILSGVFAVMGFFAGSITNVLGPRLALSIGSTGYCLYVGGLWAYQTHQVEWFLLLASAILGFTASLLWSAQGSIMMSYPTETDKGRSFSLFWAIFQLGTVVGSFIALGISVNSLAFTVDTAIYLAFLVIMLTAIFSSWTILPAHFVVRGDGTLVELQDYLSPAKEFKEVLKLFKDWRTAALFPMFFASNYFYVYQGAIVVVLFNGRTRALVSLVTGLGSIVGALVIGMVTDKLPFKRRTRTLCAVAFVAIYIVAVWSAGLAFQLQFSRTNLKEPADWSQGRAIGPILLLAAYYIGDALFQGLAYYIMASLTNDPFKLARYAAYYKGAQAAGTAVASGMDAVKTPYLTELLVSWSMMAFSLVLVTVVVWQIRDSNYEAEAVATIDSLGGKALEGAAMPHELRPAMDVELTGAPEGEDNKASDADTKVAEVRYTGA